MWQKCKIKNLPSGVYRIVEFKHRYNTHELWGKNLPKFGKTGLDWCKKKSSSHPGKWASYYPRNHHQFSLTLPNLSVQKLSQEVANNTLRPTSPPHQLIINNGWTHTLRNTTASVECKCWNKSPSKNINNQIPGIPQVHPSDVLPHCQTQLWHETAHIKEYNYCPRQPWR